MNLIAVLIWCAVIVPPFWLILPRAGLSPYWGLGAVVPVGVPVLLWYLALARWPGDGGAASPGGRV